MSSLLKLFESSGNIVKHGYHINKPEVLFQVKLVIFSCHIDLLIESISSFESYEKLKYSPDYALHERSFSELVTSKLRYWDFCDAVQKTFLGMDPREVLKLVESVFRHEDFSPPYKNLNSADVKAIFMQYNPDVNEFFGNPDVEDLRELSIVFTRLSQKLQSHR